MKKRENRRQQGDASIRVIKIWCYGAAVSWAILIVGVAGWLSYRDWQETLETGRQTGWSALEKDYSYRTWIAGYGGVYVPFTETTPPNPYLSHFSRRDVTTDTGQQLTLVNPAYMTRQVHELEKERYGLRGHITSLKPIRPQNKPDPWEKKALEQLEDQGMDEIHELVEMNGQPYMRVMKPMLTMEFCLKCHAHQGYKIGDQRGGISVSVPMQTFLDEFQKEFIVLLSFFLTVLLSGYVGIIVFYQTVRAHFKKRIQAEKRFITFFSSVNDAILVHPLLEEGFSRFIEVNSIACSRYGYSRDEFLQLAAPDITKKADAEKHSASDHQRRLLKVGHLVFETVHIKKSGEEFPVEINANIIDEDNGHPLVLSVVRDISVRKQAEEELRYSENRFRRLVENAADAILMFDGRGRFEVVNGQACKSLGYTEDELRQLSVADINVEFTEETFGEITSQGSSIQWPITKTGTHQRKDGSTFPVEVHVDRLETKKGLRFVAVARDITERMRTEEQIGRLNNLREELLGLGSLEKKLTCVTEAVVDIFNADFCRIWIIKPGDLCHSGCPHARVTEGPHVCRHRDRCLHLAASSGRYSGLDSKMHGRVPFGCYKIGRVASGDIPSFNTNDVIHDPRIHNQEWARQLGLVSFTGYRLFSETGGPIGVLALFSKHVIDPQEVGLLEGVANSTSQVVQVTMAEAEKEIMQTRLLRSQKMEAIGLMASGVAHDLNNILAGVVGYPELMLLQLPQSSELRKPIKAIQESGKRATTVVEDLLTVARGVASTREPHNINILIQEYLDSPEFKKLKSMHPGVVFTKQLDAEHSIISCSPMHIKKTLMNLMTNAVEAVGDTGNVLVLTGNRQVDRSDILERDMEPGTYVFLTVQDDGPGITADDLEHIFEPFYTKKVMGHSGTGLGLAIVWNTVQDHNGRVFVDSSEKGTRFQLYFPVSKKEEIIFAEHDTVEKLTSNSEHILVVDDESQLRDIASQMLQSLGYVVDSVCSGEFALKFVKKKPVDLIVIDMQMEPGMNGCQTYEEILEMYPEQKAIIASGFSENDDVKTALQLGASGFIKKPYSMNQFGRLVREALNS